MSLATGRLEGDGVVVDDTAQANRLHNKSHAGTPQSGNTLHLHRVEAIHCMEMGWLDVPGTDAVTLLQDGAKGGAQTEVDLLCYTDLRDRGLIVRLRTNGMDVWARGASGKEEPWFTTKAFAERVPVTAQELADLPTSHVSIVDEDGGVTHYTRTATAPHGDLEVPDLPAMDGTLLDDRVLVADPLAAQALSDAFHGTPHGSMHVLSLVEAEALRAAGVLRVDGDLGAHARARHQDFDTVLAAHEALSASGVLAKSGYRFGTHLRAYKDDPDDVHAEWLVHCAAPDDSMAWSDLSRGMRLAHGVKKRFLVAVAESPVRFLELAWFRP